MTAQVEQLAEEREAPSRLAQLATAAPLGVVLIALLVATYFRGAFQLQYWGVVAILALAAVAAAVWSGGCRVTSRGLAVALGCAWLLAAWSLLSATWADSPSAAVEGGCRTVLYAALFTLAATSVRGRVAGAVGGVLVGGIALVAAITLGRLLGPDGDELFLAGRLNSPVEYRNATACLFAFTFWPLIAAAAARSNNAALRGLCLGGAGLGLELAFLTQARGMALGLVVGAVVILALGPDRVRRAWLALIAAGGVALVGSTLLAPYDAFIDGQANPVSDIADASRSVLVVAVILAVVGVIIALADQAADDDVRGPLRTFAAVALGVVVIVGAGGALARLGDPVGFVGDRVDEFRNLDTAAKGSSRLTFGGGQRADLWDIAWREFRAHPVGGVGEGNYAADYYRERRTDRNLSTPHSLVFSQLAETGIVGALLALGFLGGIVAALVGGLRGSSLRARGSATALAAAAAVAIGQCAVDWLWLIPGVAGPALVALGLSVARVAPEAAARSTRAPVRVVRAAGGALAVVALIGITCVYVSDVQVRSARADNASPTQRLDRARSAASWNPFAIDPLYQEAGALEELGNVNGARDQLRDILRTEPDSFVTLALLGDLELRAGRPAQARAYYRRAVEQNPRDVGLQKLARRAR